MNKAVFIATSEPNSGKSIVAIGLMSLLLGKTAKVGYFRPIINDVKEGEKDNHVATILSHFNLDMQYEEAYAFTRSKIIKKKKYSHIKFRMTIFVARLMSCMSCLKLKG